MFHSWTISISSLSIFLFIHNLPLFLKSYTSFCFIVSRKFVTAITFLMAKISYHWPFPLWQFLFYKCSFFTTSNHYNAQTCASHFKFAKILPGLLGGVSHDILVILWPIYCQSGIKSVRKHKGSRLIGPTQRELFPNIRRCHYTQTRSL